VRNEERKTPSYLLDLTNGRHEVILPYNHI
jgi:hypothetical protein